MNILLIIQFNGTGHSGSQVQKNTPDTLCNHLQNALQKVLGTRPGVIPASRIDAGVHALNFCINFEADISMPLIKLPLALNAHLPRSIRVAGAYEVAAGFHARYSALGKEYIYRIYTGHFESPFEDDFAWRVPTPLDVAAMQKAADALIGTHNFSAFMAAGSNIPQQGAVRNVKSLKVEQDGNRYTVRIAADGYLYNMVRIIAGTLVYVGTGKIAPSAIAGILAGQNREAAGPTAPAKGLFLSQVFYPEGLVANMPGAPKV